MKLGGDKPLSIKQRLTPCAVFFIIVAAAELITLLLTLITGGDTLNDLLFHDRHDTFMDYFNPLTTFDRFTVAELYEDAKVFYPPLSMLFYLVMYSLIPEGVTLADGFEARQSQITLFPYCIYLVLITLAVAYVISAYSKGEKWENKLLVLISLVSYPMLYQLERGNIIILAFLFTLLFIHLKDSSSKVMRELALICLAIAAGIKVYPALFGLLLLHERRWKEALRCAIYGIAAFVLPALVFGGVDPLDMILSLGNMSAGVSSEGFGYKVNFANTLGFFSHAVGGIIPSVAIAVVSYLLGAICILGVIAHRSAWKRLCLIAIFIAGIPGVSYVYVMIFMIIPVIAFLNETRGQPRRALDYAYAALLALCLSPLPFTGTDYGTYGYPMTATVMTESLSIIILTLILAVDGGIVLARRLRKCQSGKQTA